MDHQLGGLPFFFCLRHIGLEGAHGVESGG